MARHEITSTYCDYDGTPDALKIEYSVYGVDYEIDVCPRHAERLAKFFAPLVQKSRRRTAPALRLGPPRRTEARRRQTEQIRKRALEAGEQVSDRGRLPKAILRRYS